MNPCLRAGEWGLILAAGAGGGKRGYPPVLNPSSFSSHELLHISLPIPFIWHDGLPQAFPLSCPHYGPADGDEEQDGEQSPQDSLQYEGLLYP